MNHLSSVINPNTGSIRIDGYRHRVKPGMTEDAFLESSLAVGAAEDRMGKRHTWYRFQPLTLGGRLFFVSVLFTDGVIDRVELCHSDDRYGKSWEDWSESKERSRKAFHDRWLRENLGPKPLSTAYPWGSVDSWYDARSGGSSITIRYESTESDRRDM